MCSLSDHLFHQYNKILSVAYMAIAFEDSVAKIKKQAFLTSLLSMITSFIIRNKIE